MLHFRLKYLLILLLCIQFQLYAKNHNFSIYFGLNKFYLENSDKQLIKQVVDSLLNKQIKSIEIIGHTDNLADSLYNINLSNKRANEVKNYLKALGYNENIVTIGYYGEDKPLTKNDTKEARHKNRRAEINIIYEDNGKPSSSGNCTKNDTILRTRSGVELVFNGCEFEQIDNCLEIIETPTYSNFKSGIVIMSKTAKELMNFGLLQVNLLDGCVQNQCFKNPVLIRFPLKSIPVENLTWALIKGEKTELKLVTINNKLYYELELLCPTSWINCNCKKNQKH